MNKEFMTIQLNLRHGGHSGLEFGHFGSPSSPIYAAGQFISFSRTEDIIVDSSSSSSQDLVFSSSMITTSSLANANLAEVRPKATCQSVSPSSIGSYPITRELLTETFRNVPVGAKLFMCMQTKSEAGASNSSQDHTFAAFKGEKKAAVDSGGIISVNPSNLLPRAASLSTNRVKWTQGLHLRFVECVNILGGARKATPKQILELMKDDGLTIFNIKSHLQKYRTTKCITKPIQEDKAGSTKLDVKAQLDLVEALNAQIEVQKHLLVQLEEQKNLQLHIEEQGKELQKMLDQMNRN